MTERLLHAYKTRIEELTIIPSSGGRFEVSVDNQMIFSKATLGRQGEPEEIVAAITRGEPITE